MLLDTTFLIDLADEIDLRAPAAATAWLNHHRNAHLWTTVISLGELAAGLQANNLARQFLASFRIARLHPEVAYEAANIDRELMGPGQRLGENDTWIAGFARYYGEPLVSNDTAFDRVRGLRRIAY